ncbi:ArsR/SmtB family transcription factor [Oscillospiraceae bacterium LCP25S3_E10]
MNSTQELQPLNPSVVSKLSSFFKVIGDETRVRIIYALSQGEMCVGDISEILGISQSAVSHQLKQLRMEGQVKTRREGKNIYYSLDDEHVVDILNQALKHIKHKLKESQS